MAKLKRYGNYFFKEVVIGNHIFITPSHEIVNNKIVYFK